MKYLILMDSFKIAFQKLHLPEFINLSGNILRVSQLINWDESRAKTLYQNIVKWQELLEYNYSLGNTILVTKEITRNKKAYIQSLKIIVQQCKLFIISKDSQVFRAAQLIEYLLHTYTQNIYRDNNLELIKKGKSLLQSLKEDTAYKEAVITLGINSSIRLFEEQLIELDKNDIERQRIRQKNSPQIKNTDLRGKMAKALRQFFNFIEAEASIGCPMHIQLRRDIIFLLGEAGNTIKLREGHRQSKKRKLNLEQEEQDLKQNGISAITNHAPIEVKHRDSV